MAWLLVPSRRKLSKDFSWPKDRRGALTTDRIADRCLVFWVPICQHDASHRGIVSARGSYRATNLNGSQCTMNGTESAFLLWLVGREVLGPALKEHVSKAAVGSQNCSCCERWSCRELLKSSTADVCRHVLQSPKSCSPCMRLIRSFI